MTRISKFREKVTSVALREDGGLVAAGEQNGRLQLIECQKKFVLREYKYLHKGSINSIDFVGSEVLTAGTDKSIFVTSIKENNNPVLRIQSAHSDNIKKVQFLDRENKDYVYSAS